jgi:hypothetical protein
MTSLSRPEIIKTAACPTCCAYRGEPCTFSRGEDPHGRRMYAGQSHTARKFLADKIVESAKIDIKGLASQLRL